MSSSVHYKFLSCRDYESVTFQGPEISVADLKKEIMQRKIGLGKLMLSVDLQILDSRTGKAYESEDLIPKNSSVLVARTPMAVSTKRKRIDSVTPSTSFKVCRTAGVAAAGIAGSATALISEKTIDLVKLEATEDEKVRIMMSQATQDYNPKNFVVRPSYPSGSPPPNYIRHRRVHPNNNCVGDSRARDDGRDNHMNRIKRSKGIPLSQLEIVTDIKTPGVMLTSSGQLAVPIINSIAYKEGKKEMPPFVNTDTLVNNPKDGPHILEELICPICHDLLTEAVVVQCCGNSACDECIRNKLLDSDSHTCPLCQEPETSPNGLIANLSMRKTVINFQNETGYLSVKKTYELMNHTNSWEPNQDDIHIPSELLCSICSDLLMEAVVVSCCGNSACDECIRKLLESNLICPLCDESGVLPKSLIPNKFMRKVVLSFTGKIGYTLLRKRRKETEVVAASRNVTATASAAFSRTRQKSDTMSQPASMKSSISCVPKHDIGRTTTPETGIAQPCETKMHSQLEIHMGYSFPHLPINLPPMHAHHYSSMLPGTMMQGAPQETWNSVHHATMDQLIFPPPIGHRSPSMHPGPIPTIPMTQEDFYRAKERLRQLDRRPM